MGLTAPDTVQFVRIDPGQYGWFWQRCVPTEAQRLARLVNAEFASAQADAFVDPDGVGDPDDPDA